MGPSRGSRGLMRSVLRTSVVCDRHCTTFGANFLKNDITERMLTKFSAPAVDRRQPETFWRSLTILMSAHTSRPRGRMTRPPSTPCETCSPATPGAPHQHPPAHNRSPPQRITAGPRQHLNSYNSWANKFVKEKSPRFLVGPVELRRFELLTSSMRTKRATNCAIAPGCLATLSPRLRADADVMRGGLDALAARAPQHPDREVLSPRRR